MQKLLQKKEIAKTLSIFLCFFLPKKDYRKDPIIWCQSKSEVQTDKPSNILRCSDVSLSPRPQWASSRLARPAVVVMKAGGVTQF